MFSDPSRPHRREDIQDDEGSRGAGAGTGARVGGSKMLGTIVAALLVGYTGEIKMKMTLARLANTI